MAVMGGIIGVLHDMITMKHMTAAKIFYHLIFLNLLNSRSILAMDMDMGLVFSGRLGNRRCQEVGSFYRRFG